MTRDEAAALLTGRGVLPTAQRIDIALLTLARPQHLSAEQIIAAIRANGLAHLEGDRLQHAESVLRARLVAHGRRGSRRASSTIRRRARITISITSTPASSPTFRSSRSCLTGRYGAAAGHRAGRRRRRRPRARPRRLTTARSRVVIVSRARRAGLRHNTRLPILAGVAQLVEHPLRKRGVGGSSPSAGTRLTA